VRRKQESDGVQPAQLSGFGVEKVGAVPANIGPLERLVKTVEAMKRLGSKMADAAPAQD
jgi:hypothetical protein